MGSTPVLSVVRISDARAGRKSPLRIAFAACAVLLSAAGLLGGGAGSAAAAVGPAVASAPDTQSAPAALPGWRRDFVDNFDGGALDIRTWGRYVTPRKSAGTLSHYTYDNLRVSGGSLHLSTRKLNGVWSSGGMSAARGFWAVGGKWAIRARFDRAYGIGYAFLLYPKGGGWPPEVDIAEGTAGSGRIMSTLHWGTRNNMASHFLAGVDMSVWHTYGVILSPGKVQYTVDGRVWSTHYTNHSPRVPMWLGLQAGAKDCAKSTKECVDHRTPTSSAIHVDWVAHWSAA